MKHRITYLACGIALSLGNISSIAAPAPPAALSAEGQKLQANYDAQLAALKAEIAKALPAVAEQKRAALEKARAATKAAQKEADDAAKALWVR